MSKSLMADIANLMLRSHFELSRISPASELLLGGRLHPLNGGPNRRTPVVFATSGRGDSQLANALRHAAQNGFFNFSVSPDPGTEVSCAVDGAGVLRLCAVNNGQRYCAELPARATAETLKANVHLSNSEYAGSQQLSGEDFLAGKGIPPAFKAIHDVIVSHAKRYLGLKDAGQAEAAEEKPSNVTMAPEAKTDEPEQMEYRVRRTQAKDLVFVGKHLGSVASSDHNGRFWRYSMFLSKGGKWIGVKEGITRWVGESDKVEAVVADSPEGTQEFFGAGYLAKALYAKLNIDHAEHIE